MDAQLKEHSTNFEELMKMLREMKRMKTNCLTEVPRRNLPKFEGINPRLWLRQCNKYFRVYNIPENQKMEVASLYMVGEPKVWMSSYMSIMKGADWTDVTCCLVSKYRDKIGLDVEDKEFKKWEDSFENYRVECVGFLEKGMEHEEKGVADVVMEKKYVQDDVVIDKKSIQDDMISYDFDDSFGLDGKSSELLPEVQLTVLSGLSGQLEKDDIETSHGLLLNFIIEKEPCESFNAGEDELCQGYQVHGSLGLNLFDISNILGDARQVFNGMLVRDFSILEEQDHVNFVTNLDKGSVMYNTQSEYGRKRKPLPWRDKNDSYVTYEVVPVEYGGFGAASKNGWQANSGGMTIQDALVDKEQSDQFYQVFDVRIAKNGDVMIAKNGALSEKQNDMIFVSILDKDSGKYNSQFENSWKMRPLPWRDKFIKSCFLAFESIMKFKSNLGDMHGNNVKVNLITAWGLGVAGPALFSVVMERLVFIFTEQWKGLRKIAPFTIEFAIGTRQFSYKELNFDEGFQAGSMTVDSDLSVVPSISLSEGFDITSENKMAVWMGNREARKEIRWWYDFSDYFSSGLQVNRTVQDVAVLLPYSRYSLEIMASSRGAISGRLLLLACSTYGSYGYVVTGDGDLDLLGELKKIIRKLHICYGESTEEAQDKFGEGYITQLKQFGCTVPVTMEVPTWLTSDKLPLAILDKCMTSVNNAAKMEYLVQ